jgi:putative redox protein
LPILTMSSTSSSALERDDAVPVDGAASRPTSTTVHASWRGARRYEIGRPGGPSVTIDAAGVAGLGPVDTMLGALAACSAIDVLDYLAKRRTPAQRCDVRVDAERRATAPRRVLRARLVIELDGANIETHHAERAIALSFQTYCSVSASLAPDVTIESQLVLNGAAEPVVVQRGSEVGA